MLCFCALRFDGNTAVGAVLGAELDVDEAQEVIDLGERCDGRAHPAAACALLDRDRGRDAAHGIDFRYGRRLHHGARVGVETLEVSALPLCEDDVKGERRFARARRAGDYVEAAARQRRRDVLEVVFACALDHNSPTLEQQRLHGARLGFGLGQVEDCLLYTSPSPRDCS